MHEPGMTDRPAERGAGTEAITKSRECCVSVVPADGRPAQQKGTDSCREILTTGEEEQDSTGGLFLCVMSAVLFNCSPDRTCCISILPYLFTG